MHWMRHPLPNRETQPHPALTTEKCVCGRDSRLQTDAAHVIVLSASCASSLDLCPLASARSWQ